MFYNNLPLSRQKCFSLSCRRSVVFSLRVRLHALIHLRHFLKFVIGFEKGKITPPYSDPDTYYHCCIVQTPKAHLFTISSHYKDVFIECSSSLIYLTFLHALFDYAYSTSYKASDWSVHKTRENLKFANFKNMKIAGNIRQSYSLCDVIHCVTS